MGSIFHTEIRVTKSEGALSALSLCGSLFGDENGSIFGSASGPDAFPRGVIQMSRAKVHGADKGIGNLLMHLRYRGQKWLYTHPQQ